MGLAMSLAGFSAANEAQNLPQPAAVSTAVTWLFAYGPALLAALLLAFFIPLFHLEEELAELESSGNRRAQNEPSGETEHAE